LLEGNTTMACPSATMERQQAGPAAIRGTDESAGCDPARRRRPAIVHRLQNIALPLGVHIDE